MKQWSKFGHGQVHLFRATTSTIDSKRPLSKLVEDTLMMCSPLMQREVKLVCIFVIGCEALVVGTLIMWNILRDNIWFCKAECISFVALAKCIKSTYILINPWLDWLKD